MCAHVGLSDVMLRRTCTEVLSGEAAGAAHAVWAWETAASCATTQAAGSYALVVVVVLGGCRRAGHHVCRREGQELGCGPTRAFWASAAAAPTSATATHLCSRPVLPPLHLPVSLQAHRHRLPEHLRVVPHPILGSLHYEYGLEKQVA